MNTRLLHGLLLLALLGVNVVAPRATASNVWLDMQIDISGPGTWALYAGANDNGGILGYSIPVQNVLTISHVSPYSAAAHDGTFTQFGGAGFSLLRSPGHVALIQGSQDLIAPTPFVVHGFGQVDSDFDTEGIVPLGGSLEQPDWGVPLLLAEGTYQNEMGQSPAVDFDSDDLAVYAFDDTSGTSWHETEVAAFPYVHSPLLDAEITVVGGDYATYQFTPPFEPDPYDSVWHISDFEGPGQNYDAYIGYAGSIGGFFEWDTTGSALGTYQAQIQFGYVYYNSTQYYGTLTIHLVPEPASALLLSLGAVGLIGAFRRGRRAELANHFH